MTWVKMPIQEQWEDASGNPASGYVIKAYLPGTTTVTPMAIDKNGSTTVTSVTLNASGVPSVSGNQVVLYIDREFKYAVFENATDAAANSSPIYGFFDNVKVGDLGTTVGGYADLLALAPGSYAEGDSVYLTDDGVFGHFVVKSGSETDDGGNIKTNATWTAASKYFERRSDILINVQNFGAIADNSTDCISAIKQAIVAARAIYTATGSIVTVWFPDAGNYYKHSEGIPIVTGVYLSCQSRHSVTLRTTGTQASVYSATESNGVFTDNLDQAVNVNTAENCGIINLKFENDGTISSTSPDSSTAFEAAIHLHNCPDIELFNVRVSCKTNYVGGIWIKNSYRANLYNPKVDRNTGYIGGTGIYIESITNATSLYKPAVYGNFAYGIKIANPDTVSIFEGNAEQAWVNLSIAADNPKVYGGYYEGGKISEIDVGWDLATVCMDWLIDHVWLNGNGGLNLRSANNRWVASGSGTNEYYIQRASGALDPQIPRPWVILENSVAMNKASVGALTAGSWGWGNSDSLGYDTIYVRLTDGTDPDTKASGYLTTGVHAIRMGNCVGGEVNYPHFEGSYTKRFASETGANGNKGNVIKIGRGDASAPDLDGYGLDDGRNVVKIVSQDYDDYRQYKEWSTSTGLPIETELNQRGAGFCMFFVWIRNNAGTLEAKITDGDDAATTYDQCFQSLSATYVTCNTAVSSGSDFGSSGVGIFSGVASLVLLNTNEQTASRQGCICGPVVTNNGDQIAVVPRVANRSVNGTDISRIELLFRNQLTDTAYDINTTNLANGEYLKVPVMGFIR